MTETKTNESAARNLSSNDGDDEYDGYLITQNMAENVREANRALAAYCSQQSEHEREPLFIKDDKLVIVVEDKRRHTFRIKQVDRGKLNYILTMGSTWSRESYSKNGGKNGPVPANIPPAVLDSVLSAGPLVLDSVQILRNLQNGILLNEDWEIVSKKGYDASTQLYLTRNSLVEPIPKVINLEDVYEGKALLWDIFHEFNFADRRGEDSVDYQNTIAALATAIARPSWEGSLPLWVVRKSMERTGGSLLQEIVGILAYGEEPTKYVFPKKSEEYEKGIDSFIAEGRRYGLIDNVLEGHNWVTVALLQICVGTGVVTLRIFGKKELSDYCPETFFAFNGINIMTKADVTGRIILTNIVPAKSWQNLKYDRTEQELRTLAMEKHPEVVRAFGIFHRYWVQQGKPGPRHIEGNFDAHQKWSNEIMAMLNCVGYTHILENLKEIQIDDNDTEMENAELILQLGKNYDVGTFFSATDLSNKLLQQGEFRRMSPGDGGTDLLDAFPSYVIEKAMKKTLNAESVGIALKTIIDRKVAGVPVFLAKKRNLYYLKNVLEQQKL